MTSGDVPYVGNFHLTMDDAVNGGAYSQNELWLLFNLAGEVQVNLFFRWKDFSDETHSQDGIYFSDDNGPGFTKVHNLDGGSFANNTWQLISIDLDSLASGPGPSLNSSFVVEFQRCDNCVIATDGMAFDDVVTN